MVQHFLQELFWVCHLIRRPHRTIYPTGPTRAIWGTYDIKQELFFLPSKKEEEFCKHTIKEKRGRTKKRGCSTNYDTSIFEQVMLNLLIIIFVKLHQSYLLSFIL